MLRIMQMSSVHKPTDVRITKQARALADEKDYEVFFSVPIDQQSMKGLSQKFTFCGVKKPTSRWERMFLTTWRVGLKALIKKVDVVEIHDSELVPIGLFLKLCGKRVVYDIHENVAEDILTKEYLPKVLRPLISFSVQTVQNFSIFFFDGIFTATPSIADDFSCSRKYALQNFPEKSALPEPLDFSMRKDWVIYAGGITRRRAILEIMDSIDYWPEPFKFILAGQFESQDLEEQCKKHRNWKRVEFLGWLDRDSLNAYLVQSKLGLVLFHPGPNHDRSQPNKIFEYMSAEVPILASNFEAWKPFIEGEECGRCVDPRSSEKIGSLVREMLGQPKALEAMASRGSKAVAAKYNWEREKQKLLRMYSEFAILKAKSNRHKAPESLEL